MCRCFSPLRPKELAGALNQDLRITTAFPPNNDSLPDFIFFVTQWHRVTQISSKFFLQSFFVLILYYY